MHATIMGFVVVDISRLFFVPAQFGLSSSTCEGTRCVANNRCWVDFLLSASKELTECGHFDHLHFVVVQSEHSVAFHQQRFTWKKNKESIKWTDISFTRNRRDTPPSNNSLFLACGMLISIQRALKLKLKDTRYIKEQMTPASCSMPWLIFSSY